MFCLYANRHNPNERSFTDQHLRYSHDLGSVYATSIRNPASAKWHTDLNRDANAGLLRFWNFGLFTLLWRADYAPEVGHIKAKCKYLEPGYLDVFTQGRVIDVGFMDRWWLTDKAMADYDVNPDEWDEQGRPSKAGQQLKQMW